MTKLTVNNIAGQLNIDLYPLRNLSLLDKPCVELSSTRPLQVTKLLIGKTPEQALSVIPLLFSVCGVAQSRAALMAIDINLSTDREPALETARDMLVLVENAKEHLFRTFIDWPKLFKLENKTKDLVYLSQIINEFKLSIYQIKYGILQF